MTRNDKIFDEKDISTDELCCLVFHGVSTCREALDVSFPCFGLLLLSSSKAIKSWTKDAQTQRANILWKKCVNGWLKRNIDESAGIGSVLRNCDSHFLCFFCCSISQSDSNAAKFYDIEKGLSILAGKPKLWNSCLGIAIESNSMVSVSYASSNDKHPWVLDHVHSSIVNFSKIFHTGLLTP